MIPISIISRILSGSPTEGGIRSRAGRVSDLEGSIKFYAECLGMILTHRAKIPETNGEIALLKIEGSEQIFGAQSL